MSSHFKKSTGVVFASVPRQKSLPLWGVGTGSPPRGYALPLCVPTVLVIERYAIGIATFDVMTEITSRLDDVARRAKRLPVLVALFALLEQWHDMVDFAREDRVPLSQTLGAQREVAQLAMTNAL